MSNLFKIVSTDNAFYERYTNFNAIFESLKLAQIEGELFIGPQKTQELFFSIDEPLEFFKSLARTLFLGFSFTVKEQGSYDMKSFPKQYQSIVAQYTASSSYDSFRGNTALLGIATIIGYTKFLNEHSKEIKIRKSFYTKLLTDCFNLFSCNEKLNTDPAGREYNLSQTFDKNSIQMGQQLFYFISSIALEQNKNSQEIKGIILNYIIGSFTPGEKWFKCKKSVFNFELGRHNNIGGICQNLKNLNTFLKKQKLDLLIEDEKNLIKFILKAMVLTEQGREPVEKAEQIWSGVWITLIKEIKISKKAIAYVEKALNDNEFKELKRENKEAIISLMQWVELGECIETKIESDKSTKIMKI